MQTEFLTEFNTLIGEFRKITKRVLQNSPLSVRKTKLNEYVTLLCHTFNDIVLWVNKNDKLLLPEEGAIILERFEKCKTDLLNCGEKLKYNFAFIDNQLLLSYPIFDDSESEFSDANSDLPLSRSSSLPDEIEKLKIPSADIDKTNSSPDFSFLIKPEHSISTLQTSSPIMATAEQKRTFINMCASTIRSNYDGNPLGLESFIDKINLIEELTDENLIPLLVRFILSKLEGKARESIPGDVSSIDNIKSCLRGRIKPDNSKVVKGKLASLNVVNGNLSEFSKQMEELADAFQRSLIVEGVTHEKAHEMAIEVTVATCRANSKSDLIKSILASSKFDDPKDVVAKLIIEQTNEVNEKNVLRLNADNTNNNFNNNSRAYVNNGRRTNYASHRNTFSRNHSFFNNNQNSRNNNFQRGNFNRHFNNNSYNNQFGRNGNQYINNNSNNNGIRRFYNGNNNNNSNSNRFRNDGHQPNGNHQANVRSLNLERHQEELTASIEN